jgi:choline dehydrogenase-like flavoprotein
VVTRSEEFDAIVVGSGPGGAATAAGLARHGKRVLVLEQGGDAQITEGALANKPIYGAVQVSDDLTTARGLTAGGSTAIYFAVAGLPPLATFARLGVDLASELEEARGELPLNVLPDEVLGAQTLAVRDSARALGHAWEKNLMLVDLSKCATGYRYESKWTARTYVREAVERGAVLRTGARVLRVIVDQGRAVGVEYRQREGKHESDAQQAFGARVVLAAGACASAGLLLASGLKSVVGRGFYCCPGRVLMGVVPGLRAGDSFVGSMAADLGDGIALGDASLPRAIYRLYMLTNGRFVRMWLHSKTVGVGVEVRDALGGGLREDGSFHKELTREDLQKLDQGVQAARRIVEKAGGKYLLTSRMRAIQLGGTLRIGEQLDEGLQTEIAHLHVCDGSVIPQDVKVPPTVTLVCLGKYLANRLARTL